MRDGQELSFDEDVFALERFFDGYFWEVDFLDEPRRDEAFFVVEDLFDEDFFEEAFFDGTFPPSRRASDSPMAIACFLLFTFFPLDPDMSVPFFLSCIAFSTLSCAFSPYFATVSP